MGSAMVKVRYPFVVQDTDKRGNVRLYFRRKGQTKVRIEEPLGSPEFVIRYQQLLNGMTTSAPDKHISKPTTGTWRWLCAQYFASSRFRGLGPTTQRKRRLTLEETFALSIFTGATEVFADMPVSRMGSKAVRELRDRKGIGVPAAANQRTKAISSVFAWALENEVSGVSMNPARGVAHFKTNSTGLHAWTPEEVEQYEAHHAIGTKARLALALLLYTGVRRSDVVRLGASMHATDGSASSSTRTATGIRSPSRYPSSPSCRRSSMPLRPAI